MHVIEISLKFKLLVVIGGITLISNVFFLSNHTDSSSRSTVRLTFFSESASDFCKKSGPWVRAS
jgi:hypothetical protein